MAQEESKLGSERIADPSQFQERELAAVDALYQAMPEKGPFAVDFEVAKNIGLINAETAKLIGQKVPNHEELFQRDFSEYVSSGRDRKEAFRNAFMDVYLWALYEEELWTNAEIDADPMKDSFQKKAFGSLGKVLAIPLDTFGTNGRPELRAALTHLSSLVEGNGAAAVLGKGKKEIEEKQKQYGVLKAQFASTVKGVFDVISKDRLGQDVSNLKRIDLIQRRLAQLNENFGLENWGFEGVSPESVKIIRDFALFDDPEAILAIPESEREAYKAKLKGNVLLARRMLAIPDDGSINKNRLKRSYDFLINHFNENSDKAHLQVMRGMVDVAYGYLDSLTISELNNLDGVSDPFEGLDDFINVSHDPSAERAQLTDELAGISAEFSNSRVDVRQAANAAKEFSNNLLTNGQDLRGLAEAYLQAFGEIDFERASGEILAAFYSGPLRAFVEGAEKELSTEFELPESVGGGGNVDEVLKEAFGSSISPTDLNKEKRELRNLETDKASLDTTTDYFAQSKFRNVTKASSKLDAALAEITVKDYSDGDGDGDFFGAKIAAESTVEALTVKTSSKEEVASDLTEDESRGKKIASAKAKLRKFNIAEEAGKKVYDELKVFVEHLQMVVDALVKPENLTQDGFNKKKADYSAVIDGFESLSSHSSPKQIKDFYTSKNVSGVLEHSAEWLSLFDSKLSTLDTQIKDKKASIETKEKGMNKVSNLSDAAAAKRIIAAIIRQKDPELSEVAAMDMAAIILKKDLRMLQSGESAQEIAERGASNEKLSAITDAWIKRNVLSYGIVDGKKTFEGFDVADFKDPAKIIKAIDDGRLDMSKETGKNAMLAMAAVQIYEEQVGRKFTGLRELEDKLKDMITDELEEDGHQDEAGSATIVAKMYNKDLKEAKRAMRAHVKHLDDTEKDVHGAKLEELVARGKKLREERLNNAKLWPSWRYDAEYQLLMDEAKEYGIESEFAQATVINGFKESVYSVRAKEISADIARDLGKGLGIASAKLTGDAIAATAKVVPGVAMGGLKIAGAWAKLPLYMLAKPGAMILNKIRKKQIGVPSISAQVKEAARQTFIEQPGNAFKGIGSLTVGAVKDTAGKTREAFGQIKVRPHADHSKVDAAYLDAVAARSEKKVAEKQVVPGAAKPVYSDADIQKELAKLRSFRGSSEQIKKAA